jgi:transposase InsO family protein
MASRFVGVCRMRPSTTPAGVTVCAGSSNDFFLMYYGTEFASNHFDARAYFRGIDVDVIRPGKSVDNAHIESFNGRIRDECLNSREHRSTRRATTTTADPCILSCTAPFAGANLQPSILDGLGSTAGPQLAP